MAEASKRYGDPRRIPFTPTAGNVSAGQVVLLGNLVGVSCGIATQDITNAVEGSLEIGGGVYEVTMLSNLANYALAYWDDTNNKLTSTSTNNAIFGYVVGGGGGGANATVQARHLPYLPRV
jgi:hypothetical protein